MTASTDVTPSDVEGPDGITARDRLAAELGTRLKDNGYPGAVTDPAQVAAIRREMQAHRDRQARRPAWRRRLASAFAVLEEGNR